MPRAPKTDQPEARERESHEKPAPRSAGRPAPARLAPRRAGKRGYRVVAVSLYTAQADFLDWVKEQLDDAGHVKMNRSFVAQGAITALAQHFQDEGITTPEAISEFFRRIRRTRVSKGTGY